MKKALFIIIILIGILVALLYWAFENEITKLSQPEKNYTPIEGTPYKRVPAPDEELSGNNKRLLPDYAKTPGDILTTDKKKMCVSGYAGSVRHVTEATKKRIFAEYNVSMPVQSGAWEIDHLIPLLNGGSNDEKNLWPEPAPEYHWKDKMELYIHSQICTGKLTVEEGQKLFTNGGWYTLYQQQKDFLGGDNLEVVR